MIKNILAKFIQCNNQDISHIALNFRNIKDGFLKCSLKHNDILKL